MSKKTKKLWHLVMLVSINLALLIIITSTNAEAVCLGCSGERVAEIQRALRNIGCYSGEISGSYDFATRRAVKIFQQKNNLNSTGEADYKTVLALGLGSKNENFSAQTELLARFIQKHGGADYHKMLSKGIETLEAKGNLTLSQYIIIHDPDFLCRLPSDEPSPEAYSAAIAAIKSRAR